MSLGSPNINVIHRLGGYSAAVEIELLMDNRSFSVAQIGRGMLIVDESVSLPCQHGELILTVDGNPRRWRVTVEPSCILAIRYNAQLDEIAE